MFLLKTCSGDPWPLDGKRSMAVSGNVSNVRSYQLHKSMEAIGSTGSSPQKTLKRTLKNH